MHLCVQFKYMPTSPWCASWDGVVEAITANQTLKRSDPGTVRWGEATEACVYELHFACPSICHRHHVLQLRLSNSFATVALTSKELVISARTHNRRCTHIDNLATQPTHSPAHIYIH